jgi:hypothetical protein
MEIGLPQSVPAAMITALPCAEGTPVCNGSSSSARSTGTLLAMLSRIVQQRDA